MAAKPRTLPKVLYRNDGERFVLNANGEYEMENSLMVPPYAYSIEKLMEVGGFTADMPLEWTYSPYRATLYRKGERFAIVTPNGKDELAGHDASTLLYLLNRPESP